MKVAKPQPSLKFIDLFCGIGGFRFAAESVFRDKGLRGECVFSSDIDPYARQAYGANFGEFPQGDITQIDERDMPDHDLRDDSEGGRAL